MPLWVWVGGAVWFEWNWHSADPMFDTGHGFGAFLVYFVYLPVAVLLSIALGLVCFGIRSFRKRRQDQARDA